MPTSSEILQTLTDTLKACVGPTSVVSIAGPVEDVPWSESLIEQVGGVLSRAMRDGSAGEPFTILDQDGFISVAVEDTNEVVSIDVAFRPKAQLDPMPIIVSFTREPSPA